MKTNQQSVCEFTDAFKMFKTAYGDYSEKLLRENPKTSKLRYDLVNEEYNDYKISQEMNSLNLSRQQTGISRSISAPNTTI